MALGDLLRSLFDFEMREVVTTRMLPLIYRFAVISMAALTVLGVVTAFMQSPWLGLVWLLFGPVVFLILVVVVRVFLEFPRKSCGIFRESSSGNSAWASVASGPDRAELRTTRNLGGHDHPGERSNDE